MQQTMTIRLLTTEEKTKILEALKAFGSWHAVRGSVMTDDKGNTDYSIALNDHMGDRADTGMGEAVRKALKLPETATIKVV